METCPYCGVLTDTPCEEPPVDVCSHAIEKFYGDPTKDKA